MRFILKFGPRSHIGDEELKTVGMLKVEDRGDNINSTMFLKSTMKMHQSTWTLTFPNLPTLIGTIRGAVQPISLFQKSRVSSTIFFSILLFGNRTSYQLILKPPKLIINLKRQSKATDILIFTFSDTLSTEYKLEGLFQQHSIFILWAITFYYVLF